MRRYRAKAQRAKLGLHKRDCKTDHYKSYDHKSYDHKSYDHKSYDRKSNDQKAAAAIFPNSIGSVIEISFAKSVAENIHRKL
jgi:hypothetical protein